MKLVFTAFAALNLAAAELPQSVATETNLAYVAPASNEAEMAIKRFRVPPGFKVEVFAAEPLLANPVAFCIDEKGRFYVAETFRLHTGVTDIRGHMNWLDNDLASRSVEDRIAMMKKYEAKRLAEYTRDSDRVRMVMDTDNDGRADKATVFADGFNGLPDGLGAGVLARKGAVYFANIPNLWMLRDNNGDGVADSRKSLHYGYGVRVGFIGHDLHGLIMGPDGKLYFSIGDRGAHIQLPAGKTVENHETGAVYRCDPDGSNLEIFASGLRNPQELAFDEHGNLWTGENNSDGGDPARWVYLAEGGDSGWRIGFQFINTPNARGPWMSERMCYPEQEGQPAYHLPPLANIGNGPSGLAYYPGTGLPKEYRGQFFLSDFRGGTASGVHAIAVKPKGASFEVVSRNDFIWEVLVTDGDFGYDGCFYISDWVNGWLKTGKGRIYRIWHEQSRQEPAVDETRKLFAEGFEQRPVEALTNLLSHPDMRVRQEAQFALAGRQALDALADVARTEGPTQPRLHGIWGLGQLARGGRATTYASVDTLLSLAGDSDAEVRAQVAKTLGDVRAPRGREAILKLISDSEARVRYFAAISAGKLAVKKAREPLLALLRENNNRDRYLRHAGIVGLEGCSDPHSLRELAKDESPAVRLAAVVALRRLNRREVAAFLNDNDFAVALEAARAINDLPITPALRALAEQISRPYEAPPRSSTNAVPSALAQGKDVPQVDISAAFFRRVLNANFRGGAASNAQALASFAANASFPDALRNEALGFLGQWTKPPGRDAVTGLWRPLPTRPLRVAKDALQPSLSALLGATSDKVKIAAIKAAGALGIEAPELKALAHEGTVSVRVEALKALAILQSSELETALQDALDSSDENLRREATQLQAAVRPAAGLDQIKKALADGTLREKQSALVALGNITNQPAADGMLSEWLDKLLDREVPAELHLDLLDALGKRTQREIQVKLRLFESSRATDDDLRSFRECFTGGNKDLGHKIFLEKAEVSCVRCHKAGGEGGEVGPDLTGIGSRQTRQYILEGIAFPNKHIAPGYESVVITMKDGVAYAGVLKSETASAIQLNSPEDGLLDLKKADIKSRERAPSAMPEEFRQILTKRELRDLVEFLAGLN